MNIKAIKVGEMENMCYLVWDKDKNAILIDCSWEAEKIEKEIKNMALDLKAIFLTHGHFDHTNACKYFSGKVTDIYMDKKDEFLLCDKIKFSDISMLDSIKIGEMEINIIHTPGHSPGSTCYLIDGRLFSGDTIFIGSCGRVDLPGSNPEDMKKSLVKISKLPIETIIYTGHFYEGYETNLASELENNSCLKMTEL
jgi:glyoxylase-like metal-dependent hydrolase (beta-lactamase superfamily II)